MLVASSKVRNSVTEYKLFGYKHVRDFVQIHGCAMHATKINCCLFTSKSLSDWTSLWKILFQGITRSVFVRILSILANIQTYYFTSSQSEKNKLAGVRALSLLFKLPRSQYGRKAVKFTAKDHNWALTKCWQWAADQLNAGREPQQTSRCGEKGKKAEDASSQWRTEVKMPGRWSAFWQRIPKTTE